MYTNKYDLNIGCDPEFFATYEDKNPKGIGFDPELPFAVPPAYLARLGLANFIGGVPKHPHYFKNDKGKIIGDGVAFEVNLDKPYKNPMEMLDDVRGLIDLTVPFETNGFKTTLYPTVNFDYGSFWDSNILLKDEYMYWAMIFGCDPSKNAYNPNEECPLLDVSNHPFRYSGGHFHFSGDKDIEEYPHPFIKLLDLTIGNYTVFMSKYEKLEKMRKKYYGKAGNYRLQKYPTGEQGVEYRTPSNAWLSFNEDQYKFIFELVETTLDFLKEPKLGQQLLEKYSEPTRQAIETSDKELAKNILNSIGV